MTDRTYTNPQTGEVIADPPIRPFSAVLHELGEGSTESELGEAFWDLLQRVQDTGKAGSVTLTIKVAGDGRGRVQVLDEVKLRLPEYNRPQTSFFIDKHGNASRRDPNQPEIPGVTRIVEDAFAAIVGEVSEGLPDGVKVRYGQG